MPYRRLPNTDSTRLKALKQAIQAAENADYTQQVLQMSTRIEAQNFLMQFETTVSQYHDGVNTRVSANKKYRHDVQYARMYISHFIQVLNMAIIRGEIRKDARRLYGLEVNSNLVPELSTEESLLEWGEKIIKGEQQRTAMGGFPIYNPAINKVKVYYDIFKENMVNHDLHRRSTVRVKTDIDELRKAADVLILDIWNQVEAYYRDLLPYERLCRCQEYGLIYYYRTGEKKLSAETDREIQDGIERQQTIQWSGEV